jgi:hypothetical protein
MSADERIGRDDRLYPIALLVVAIAIVIPIWVVNYPGMVDYPNHLTRCFILAHYAADPIWQARYYIVHTPSPNLAVDLIVAPLNHILPIFISGKIFLTLTALLYLLGCVWLGYAILGKHNWIAPLAALTFYNSSLFYGFVNYVFGVAVFLCAFAFWMQTRDRMSAARFLICCAFSLAAYLSHLSAYVFLGIACVTVTAIEWPRRRSFLLPLRQLAWLACPLLLMAGFVKQGAKGPAAGIDWATPREKLIYLFAPIRTYSLAFDAVVLAIVLVCAVVVLRNSKIHPAAWAGGAMFFLFLVTPSGMLGVSGADARYILPAFLLVLLSIEPTWNKARRAALLVATLAMIARTAGVAASWVAIDRRERQVLHMGDALPENARIFVVGPHQERELAKYDRGFPHVINLWALSHHASVSLMFLIPGQQPLLSRQPLCDTVQTPACLATFDYIWSDGPLPETEQFLRSVADPAVTWESVTLWRIRR